MTAAAFNAWIAEMKSAGLAKSDADCARMLGYEPKHLPRQKSSGGDQRLALACAALLSGLSPYGDSPA